MPEENKKTSDEEVKDEALKEEAKEEKKSVEEPKKDESKPEPKVVEKVKKEVKVPAKFKDLVKQIEELNVIELSELVKILEEKFGVSAAAAIPTAVGAPAEAGSGEEEKTVFTIELKDAGSQKIQVIKAIREITEKALKEAKDLVDAAPQVVKENVKKEEAEEMKKKLEDAGATVELK